MKLFAVLPLVAGAVFACGGSPTPSSPTPETATSGATAPGAAPACSAIHAACEPHEAEGGVAKECHDLGEAPGSTEAQCAAKQADCMAACSAKK